ncbi:hypothetical protein JJQ59_33865 (plasmid) [Cupriavidus necator]|uniref:hypothetical protein n=1 Tax=Cupriavidus necator TaxID=106590 RepID=UPI0016743768|nr:hypothetical protein JJQ59_33865 [Cupriavidus necator]
MIGEVFSRKNAFGTICLWIAQLSVVMAMYGLGTWLPQIIRKNGYDLGSSLALFAVFNLAAFGSVYLSSACKDLSRPEPDC